MRLAAYIAAIASYLLAGSALAAATASYHRTNSAQFVATAFRSICLNHAGDMAAQEKAAQDVPWKLRLEGSRNRQSAIYQNWPLRLTISKGPTGATCAITSALPPATTTTSVVRDLTTMLGFKSSETDVSGDEVYWAIDPSSGGKSVSFGLASDVDGKVGTFMLLVKKAN